MSGSIFKSAVEKLASAKPAARAESRLVGKLAPTILTTGAKDQLITQDAYSIDSSKVLNTPLGKVSEFATNFMESFRASSNNILGNLANIAKVDADGGISFDKDALIGRAEIFLDAPLTTLSSDIQGQLAKSVGLNIPEYNHIVGTVAGVSQAISGHSLESATGLANLINRVTGDQSLMDILDVGAEASVVSMVVNEAIRLGFPQAVDTMIQKTKSAKAAQQALLNNVRGALVNSDMQTLQLMVDKVGVGFMLSKVPNAAELLAKNYRLPKETSESDYPACYTELTEMLDTLKPGWAVFDRNGEKVSDLSVFAQASDDAKLLFKTNEVYQVPATIAANYPSKDLLELGRKLYPHALV